LPLVRGIDGSFYFRPESGGRIWLSPHDETPTDACDAAPEELDVAIAIARMEEVVDWKVKSVERKWAGLRSFAPDRLPVIGRDAMVPEFFWFAGQGGFGIQTAPAAAWLARALILGQSLPPVLSGVDPARYYPDRLA
jgi:D-arginine dehydrogenase